MPCCIHFLPSLPVSGNQWSDFCPSIFLFSRTSYKRQYEVLFLSFSHGACCFWIQHVWCMFIPVTMWGSESIRWGFRNHVRIIWNYWDLQQMEIHQATPFSLLPSMQFGWFNAATLVTAACRGRQRAGMQHQHLPPESEMWNGGRKLSPRWERFQLKASALPSSKTWIRPGEVRKSSNHHLTWENKSEVRSKANPELQRSIS